MSLSVTRSRRSNAGNRWAEALAAVQLESGDAPDPDAEASGEEFIGKEGSDFESTDEEEYAKQGVEDGEKQVQMEEKAERRAARAKASKVGAAPTQKILERAMRQPAPKKKRTLTKNSVEKKASILWDTTRQSERSSTVKHNHRPFFSTGNLIDFYQAHAPRRPRPIAAPKTQDELIAAALELEEKNTKALNEFLQKEEEKRAAARKVVRLKIEGPVIRWISRGEAPIVEEVKPERRASETPVALSKSTVQSSVAQVPITQAAVAHSTPIPMEVDPAPIPLERSNPLGSTPVSIPTPTHAQNLVPTRASTPLQTQRMQVYVEIPSPSKSMRRPLSSSSAQGTSLAPRGREVSPSPVISRGLSIPSSQPLARPPLSSTVFLPKSPLSTCEPLVPESSSSQLPELVSSRPPGLTSSHSSEPVSSQLPESIPQIDSLRTFHRPAAVRQSSVSSSSSSKSKGNMVMYVEIPVRKKERGGTPAPGSSGRTKPSLGGMVQEPSSASAPSTSSTHILPTSFLSDHPNSSAPTLPLPTHIIPSVLLASSKSIISPSQKQTRNYVVVEYGGAARASFGWNMQAVFGDHADWEDVLIHGIKAPHPVKPTCAITGLPAPYRDSRTGIPYANAYAYKTLTRLLAHEFIWSKERGCYIGDEGKDPARGVPTNWRSAATGRF
ncbi:unnamed protein product [Rhizoctonia solani]|uniref:Vps72/YL1 C-terminal domain-containing protein n=1 Tax=Rhizoctonia solani TaxID=456999 RepID=A0A8H2XYE2_9AGAM|nr:unnamed protein product [Rhizoctonia solani]